MITTYLKSSWSVPVIIACILVSATFAFIYFDIGGKFSARINQTTQPLVQPTIDCGEGTSSVPANAHTCFVEQLATCTPARLRISARGDIFGLEIVGNENGCQIKLSIEKAITSELSNLEGKWVTCTQLDTAAFIQASKLQGDDAVDYLNRMRKGIVASALGGMNACEGTLKESFDAL